MPVDDALETLPEQFRLQLASHVDGAGHVVTTVFASTVGGRVRGGYGVPDSVVQRALSRSGGTVGTGACAH